MRCSASSALGWRWEGRVALALFQVTGLCVPFQRFPVLVEGTVFAALFNEVGTRGPGERFAVAAPASPLPCHATRLSVVAAMFVDRRQ